MKSELTVVSNSSSVSLFVLAKIAWQVDPRKREGALQGGIFASLHVINWFQSSILTSILISSSRCPWWTSFPPLFTPVTPTQLQPPPGDGSWTHLSALLTPFPFELYDVISSKVIFFFVCVGRYFFIFRPTYIIFIQLNTVSQNAYFFLLISLYYYM